MRYVFASANDHKLREIRELVSSRIELVGQQEFNIDSADETGLTFVENALIKARHADATDGDNVSKLLVEMSGQESRTARFQCVIVLLRHELDPTPLIAQGTLEGEILTEPRGQAGFGYDPIFLLPDINKTVAELPIQQKNSISHRAKALQQLLRLLP
jgi:XTP/dITP diphosphohydrolase